MILLFPQLPGGVAYQGEALPIAPDGFVFVAGLDGLPLVGADGALLYAKVI